MNSVIFCSSCSFITWIKLLDNLVPVLLMCEQRPCTISPLAASCIQRYIIKIMSLQMSLDPLIFENNIHRINKFLRHYGIKLPKGKWIELSTNVSHVKISMWIRKILWIIMLIFTLPFLDVMQYTQPRLFSSLVYLKIYK